MKLCFSLFLLWSPVTFAAEQVELSMLSGMASLDSCSGIVVNPGISVSQNALLLTAGHCVANSARLAVKGAVRNAPYSRSGVKIYSSEGALYFRKVQILFATMDGIDLALLELPLSFAELESRKVRVHSISFEPVKYIRMLSGHWAESSECEASLLSRGIKEGTYSFSPALYLSEKCGSVLAGFSGSVLLSENQEVQGIVNTTSTGIGAACAEGNPCELPRKVVPGRVYAQPLHLLKDCLLSRFQSAACLKRWPAVAWNEPLSPQHEEVIQIPISALVRKQEFNSLIARAEEIYLPIAAKLGKKLSVEKQWENTNLLGTEQVGSRDWAVKVSGALGRHPAITRDALLLALCHEFGHQLGGYPFKRDNFEPGDRIHSEAAEAQSDYFATLACARRVWAGDPENRGFRELAGSWERERCLSIYSITEQQDICLRTLEGTKSLARFFSALHRVNARIETPDPKETRWSILDEGDYPAAQCRVDTLVAGALCPKAWDDAVIPALSHPKGQESIEAEREAARFSCFARDGFTNGIRPRCWYVPK